MSLFYNYENSGKGVSKNEPRKKPFFRFWEIFLRKFWTLMFVNMIYILFCIPIVTFGPATAALMHVIRKFYLEDSIFVWHEFVTAFKKNFRQSIVIGIFDAGLIALTIYTFYSYYVRMLVSSNSITDYVIMGVVLVIAVYVFISHFYIYLQIVSLKLSMGAIIKNSLILTVAGIKNNVIAFLVSLIFISAVTFFFPFSAVVLPFIPFAWMGLVNTFCAYPVIQKHLITPYYEAKGEKNPELPEEVETEAIFTDRGGKEDEVRNKSPKGVGKVIR